MSLASAFAWLAGAFAVVLIVALYSCTREGAGTTPRGHESVPWPAAERSATRFALSIEPQEFPVPST